MIESKNITNELTEQITISWDGERIRIIKSLPRQALAIIILNPREALEARNFIDRTVKL